MTSFPSSVIKWRFIRRLMPSYVIISLWFCIASCLSGNITVLADSDKSVLLRFKEMVSDPGSVLARWVKESEDYCSFFGVPCDLTTSRVTALNISGSGSAKGSSEISRNRFTCGDIGKSPLYGFGIRRNCAGNHGALAGNLPSIIVGLTELTVLSLPFNSFSGEVPVGIWGMEKLEVLDLEGNLMAGTIPVQFTGLRNLRDMDLGFNRISDCEWKGQAGNPCAISFDWSCSGICKSVDKILEIQAYMGFIRGLASPFSRNTQFSSSLLQRHGQTRS